MAVFAKAERALARLLYANQGQRTLFDIGIVGQHVERDGIVLQQRGRIGARHRRIVDRAHVDNERSRTGRVAIADFVGRLQRAEDVTRRREEYTAAPQQLNLPAFDLLHPDQFERIAVGIRVIGQQIDFDGRIFVGRHAIVAGDGALRSHAHGNDDLAFSAFSLPVANHVGKAIVPNK